ncbi:MAG: hemin uptake protein HemP [Myxococcota bacterium]|nr:hemin uptake protein HemP [Myxococcota bacterium]
MTAEGSKDEKETDVQEETCPEESKPRMLSVQTMSSRDLLGERGLLRIEHDGEFYTLRVTRNRRLILTK